MLKQTVIFVLTQRKRLYKPGFNKQKLLLLSLLIIFGYSCNNEDVKDTAASTFMQTLEDAMILHDAGDIPGSLKYIDSAFRKINPESKHERYKYYTFCYDVYRRDYRQYEKALLYSDSMIAAFKGDKNEKYAEALSHAYSSRGDILVYMGKYEEAYNSFYKARIAAGRSDNTCALGDQDYRLGMVLYKQERYDKSAQYFKSAFLYNRECNLTFNKFYRQQEILDNIGLCYQKLRKSDSAVVYFNEALAYIDKEGKQFPADKEVMLEQARAVVYGNMAETFHRTGKTKEASELLKKGIAIGSQPGFDNMDAQSSRLKLANYYLEDKDASDAKLVLDEAQRINDSMSNEAITLSLRKAYSEYYKQQNDIAKAYEYLVAYTSLDRDLDDKKQKLQETDFTERFSNFQKEQEIAKLAESNKRKQEYLVLLIIGALMSLAIGLLIIRNWRRSRHNVMVLSKLNTQIKDQNQQLAEAYNALAQSNREKDRILQAVSHDIRNPILAVSSLADLMHLETEGYSDEQKEYISLIQDACAHALTISNDLIEISSSKQASSLEKEYADLNDMLKSCMNMLRFRAAQKNQQLTLIQNTHQHIDIYVNKEKIIRVISNIINNAIKFTPPGGLISVQAKVKAREALISIRDQGIGIPDEYKEKVFDMFTEAKRPGTEGEKPFGLGLSISRQIVEAHHGKIWFDSAPDKGTTFFISLPL